MKWSKTVLSVLSIAVIGLLALGLTSTPAYAGTASATFPVTATIQATCQIQATGVGFGNYTGAQIQSNGSVTVTCTNTTGYHVGLNAGTVSGATVTTRQMHGTGTNTDKLSYSLFSDASYSTNWGVDASSGWVAGTGNGQGQTLTVYGQLGGSQYFTPDSYTDTITATITW